MNTELGVLLLKTGGTAVAIVIPIVWLFRRGGRISLKVVIGRARGGSTGAENGGAKG